MSYRKGLGLSIEVVLADPVKRKRLADHYADLALFAVEVTDRMGEKLKEYLPKGIKLTEGVSLGYALRLFDIPVSRPLIYAIEELFTDELARPTPLGNQATEDLARKLSDQLKDGGKPKEAEPQA